ncbi:LmeA family phospholipid-binding protein [Corynebacterium sp. 335C]
MTSSRPRRIAAWSAAAILLAAVGVDTGAAIHAERQLAEHLRGEAHLPADPYVSLGGLAYLSSLFTGQWSSVSVRARDLDVPGFGLVSVESGAVDVQVPRESVWTGRFEDAETDKFFGKLQLDGLALGRQMGFTDLVIQNLEDVSPVGGWETEAIFEATPEGWDGPATVSVKLRILEQNVHVIPIEVIEAPAYPDSVDVMPGDELAPEQRDVLMRAFTLFLEGAQLPLEIPPTRIYVAGGSVFIEGEQVNTTVSPEDFLPDALPQKDSGLR